MEDKKVKDAISLAPTDIAATYRKQAEEIERIRAEWLNKARKEPPYDIFISFKDSDREHGIERTQDSIDAQDLYNALVADGYKVFFSRISLKEKVAEQYEPYIYNAIKTAKVMIVFGEKAEYFNAVWIKNEWSRFRNRIEKGEKHKNSLVVAYKDVNPGDLPIALRSRQCINAADMTFLTDLKRHIKRVMEESQQAAHLERIEIQGGQMTKKARKIANESIQTREIGGNTDTKTGISEKQQLGIVKSYIKGDQWEDAQMLVEGILLNAPNYAEALSLHWQIRHHAHDTEELLRKLASAGTFAETDRAQIDKILNYADKEFAQDLLIQIYSSASFMPESIFLLILQTVLPYNFAARTDCIQDTFDISIKRNHYSIFEILLNTLQDDEVDTYIAYCLAYMNQTSNRSHQMACIDRVLAVDSGNLSALRMRLALLLQDSDVKKLTECFEETLRYCPDINEEVSEMLARVCQIPLTPVLSDFSKQVLKYYVGNLNAIANTLQDLADAMIANALFEDAQYILNLLLTLKTDLARVYWGLCLVKVGATSERGISRSPVLLKSQPEYLKYLTMVDESRRQECIGLAKQQEQHKQKQEKRRKNKKKFKKVAIAVIISGAIVTAGYITTTSVIIPAVKYNKVTSLIDAGKNEEAYILCQDILDYKDTDQKAAELSKQLLKTAEELYKKGDAEGAGALLDRCGIQDPGYAFVAAGNYTAAVKNGLTHIVIPAGTPEVYGYAFDGVGYALTAVTIPDSVTSIGYHAFNGCSLTSINIPDSVTSIGVWAFADCDGLTSITIPGSVISIGDFAFYSCVSLTSVTIGDGVTSIGEGVFSDCTGLTSVTIPDSVTSIGNSAFRGCSGLTSVTIPDGVTSIGTSAFEDCWSLTSITFEGTIKQWKAISKGSSWNYKMPAESVACSDGNVALH